MINKRKLSHFMVVLACVGMLAGWMVGSAAAQLNNCGDSCWCNDDVTTGSYPNAGCGGESFMYTIPICRSTGTVKCSNFGCKAGVFAANGINTSEWVLQPGGACTGCPNVNNGFWQDQSGVFGTYVINGFISTGECKVQE